MAEILRSAFRLNRIACAFTLAAQLGSTAAHAVPLEIVYGDAPGEGFFDPLLGAARRSAFEFAANKWADLLAGTVPIGIDVAMDPIGGSGTNATLASAGPVTLQRNFGAGESDTWYSAALANQLVGVDVNGPDLPEISITFNTDVDGPEVLGSIAWYYGLDGEAGVDIDFVTIALHELGHGLGFFETVDAATGGFRMNDEPGIFDRMLFRPGVGDLVGMRPTERLAAIVSGGLFWNGANVVAFNGSPAPVYAPEPHQPGASLGHWDTSASPDELIEPFYTVPIHDVGLLLPALLDMGWEPEAATPTPRASPATPTPTYPPRPTAPTQQTPVARAERVYVTNFDDDTVSVIDVGTSSVIDTVSVGLRPIGVAAAPDGATAYIANFGAGTVSILDTQTNRVVDTIAVGDSANNIVVTPDGALVAVTDTAGEQTAIVSTTSNTVLARVYSGAQPSAIASNADGRLAFVTNFASKSVATIDLDARLRRAIIPLDQTIDGLVGIAIAPTTGLGYVTAFYSSAVSGLDAGLLARRGIFFLSLPDYRPEAVVVDRAGTVAYVSSHHRDTGAGAVTVFDTATQQPLITYIVGTVPEAIVLSADERTLFVANTGSGSVSVIDTVLRRVTKTIAVGAAPMGVAIVAVPVSSPGSATPTSTASAIAATVTPSSTATVTPTITLPSPTPTRTVTPTSTAPPTATLTTTKVPCAGDCDGDEQVRVNELVTAVRIALDRAPTSACAAVDRDASNAVTIDELTAAVNRALTGCP